jgi:thiol:disulfide interchange protein DsbD
MPEEAFKPSVHIQKDQIIVDIKLGEGIHLYKEKLKLKIDSKNLIVKDINYPDALIEEGKAVYENSVRVVVDLAKKENVKDIEKLKLKLSFQGCSVEGLCYEPVEQEYKFDIDTYFLEVLSKEIEDSQKKSTETDKIASSFENDSMLIVLLTFFGFGLLLSMTPCIFPMIPILSSIIVSQGEGMNAKKGFFLSLVYVLSMAFAYTLAGVLAGLFGSNLQAAMQNPYVVVSFSVVFVALAFSMFGFYEIGLPASLQSKISRVSDSASNRGGILGVAIMGFLSALIVGPCVAPPLAGTLVYIGQTGDALLGGLALFFMSLGMGVPLLLIGIGAGKFMPKPGGWMSNVSKVFGVVMLAIAIWMLEKIAPAEITMILWSMLFVISSVYLGALESLGDKRGWNALLKGLGLILLIYGLSIFIGLLSGSTNIFKPFEKFTQTNLKNLSSSDKLNFKVVKSLDELDNLLQKNRGKKIMLDFSAKWCTSCKEYDEVTFKDSRVMAQLSNYVLIRADVTENSTKQKEMSKKYKVFGPPAIIFIDENGDVLEDKKIVGYKTPKEFLSIIH